MSDNQQAASVCDCFGLTGTLAHDPACPNAKTAMRRIVVTHTASYVYHQAEVDKAWRDGPALPNYVRRPGDEDDPDSRAMAVFEVYGDTPLELFHPLQDDDTGYEVEDYDPEA